MSKVVFSRRFVPLAFLVLFAAAFPSAAQYTNGIYAEFNTSMGSYTCKLEYALAPRTVANFIALATGGRSWLDLPSGTVKTNPFYDGTTFHRVIAGFMNQGGSRNALGTDGPGYTVLDEFTPGLRHDSFGVLSMANSGPDSNGSQFFITVGATPWLNDVHSVFGKLFGGSNVVYNINHVATDGNSKPLTNVVLNSVVIKRIGATALAFDIHAQSLALVTNLNLKIAKAGAGVSLTFSNRLAADNRLYSSTNLKSWTGAALGIETALPVSNTTTQSAAGAVRFFRAAQIQYPPGLFVPRNVLGRTVTFTFPGIGTNRVVFNQFGGGTYTNNLTSSPSGGTLAGYNWSQDAYRGRLVPIVFNGALAAMVLHLDFDSNTAGSFKGTVYPAYPSDSGSGPVSGTFIASP